MPSTLLSRAYAVPVQQAKGRPIRFNREEEELLAAWLQGKLTNKQIIAAKRFLNASALYSWLAPRLRLMVEHGTLVIR